MDTSPARMATDFRAAADVIRTGGHTKERFRTDEGEHCAVGALIVANDTNTGHWTKRLQDECKVLASLLGRDSTVPWMDVAGWNDEDQRTATDVIELFEVAAQKAEAELP